MPSSFHPKAGASSPLSPLWWQSPSRPWGLHWAACPKAGCAHCLPLAVSFLRSTTKPAARSPCPSKLPRTRIKSMNLFSRASWEPGSCRGEASRRPSCPPGLPSSTSWCKSDSWASEEPPSGLGWDTDLHTMTGWGQQSACRGEGGRGQRRNHREGEAVSCPPLPRVRVEEAVQPHVKPPGCCWLGAGRRREASADGTSGTAQGLLDPELAPGRCF